jgi:hypothetical protein
MSKKPLFAGIFVEEVVAVSSDTAGCTTGPIEAACPKTGNYYSIIKRR